MPAEQRHDGRAVLGDRDHRRLGALVGQQGRDGADQDAGGADADDGHARQEQLADMAERVLEGHRRACRSRPAVHRAAHRTGDAGGERLAARRQAEDRNHGSSVRVTRIMEK